MVKTAILLWNFDICLTFFIDCGYIHVPNGEFWGSTGRPHIEDLAMNIFFLWGPLSMSGELGMAEKWSILDQKWQNMPVLSTPQSGLGGSKMVSPCNCFWSFGTHFGQFKTRLIFVLQNISTKPGQNLKNRTLGALPPLLWLAEQKQPAPFQKSRRKELKEHVEDEKWL